MLDGSKKLNSKDALEAVVGVIRDHLEKCSQFANNSLCYYGIEFSYSIDLSFVSRGEDELHVRNGAAVVGDIPVGAVKDDTAGISGTRSTGKKRGPKPRTDAGKDFVKSVRGADQKRLGEADADDN